MASIPMWRSVLKSNFNTLRGIETDQNKGLPQPPLEKPAPTGAELIPLPEVNPDILAEDRLFVCMKNRRSRRKYTDAPLSLDELSFLLWATQEVQRVFGKNFATFRPVPLGGARHAFETYLAIDRVSGLEPGLYRYLALSHQLYRIKAIPDFDATMGNMALDQPFVGQAAVVFIWSCLPYRMEWRYQAAAYKTILLDAGHLCQNLYLAGEAAGCGVCAIGAYDQERLDRFLELDGEDEFVVYMAPVGKV